MSIAGTIHGSNVWVEKKVGSVFYSIACATGCAFNFKNELIGKTDVNAGLFPKRRVRWSDCSGTVSGVSKISNEGSLLSVFHFLEEGVRRVPGTYQFIFEDDDGNQKVLTITGLVESVDFDNGIDDFSTFDLNIIQSGGFEMADLAAPDVPGAEEWYSDWWTLADGATEISGASAVWGYELTTGDEVLEVDRSGLQYDLVTSPPANRQAKPNTTAGTIQFEQPGFPGGETVFVLFKRSV